MPPYYYIAQSDVEAYLGVTLTGNGIAAFNLLRPLIQDMIDNYCNRSWNFTNPVVENFDALTIDEKITLANYTFFPKYTPVSSTPVDNNYPLAGGIISAVIGTSALDLNYVVNYGTHIKFSASFPSVILANPLGFKMVKITYNSDAAQNVPGPVKAAFVMWMARMIQNAPDAGKETTRVQTGLVQAYYNPENASMPSFVKMVLDKYRIIPQDHF